MLKVKSKTGSVRIRVRGSLAEILADTVMMLNGLRDSIAKRDPDMGKEFERCITQEAKDGVLFDTAAMRKMAEAKMLEALIEQLKSTQTDNVAPNIVDLDADEEEEIES